MDAVTFNSSPSLPDVVGGAMCRVADSGGSAGDKSGQQSPLALLVGGLRNSRLDAGDDYLRIDALHVPTASWSPQYVVTNKARNRAYHSIAVVNRTAQTATAAAEATASDQGEARGSSQVALLFGGGVVDRSSNSPVPLLLPAGEVLQISSGLFGLKVNSIFADEGRKLAFLGLSASTVGQGNDRVVIFGGYDPGQSKFNSEVHLFTIDGQPLLKPVEIDPTLPQPPPRAYHSAIVLGDQNQYLLILGGEGAKKEMLADCWLLDLTDVLAAEYNPEPVVADANPKDAKKAPPPKGGKDTGKPAAYARWISVPAAAPIPDPQLPEGEDPRYLDFNTARSRFQALAIPQPSPANGLECELWLCGGLVKEDSGLVVAAMGNMPRCLLRILPAAARNAAPAPASGKNAAPPPAQGPQVTMTPLSPILANTLPAVVQANQRLSSGGSSASSTAIHPSVRSLCAFASTKAVALSACPVLQSDFESGESQQSTPTGFLITGGRVPEASSSSQSPSPSASSACPPFVMFLSAASASPSFLQRVKKAVQRNYLHEGHSIRREASSSLRGEEEKVRQRRIDYLNGDVYQGSTITVQTSLPSSPVLPSHGSSAEAGNRGEDEAKTDGTDEAITVTTDEGGGGEGGPRLYDLGTSQEEEDPAVEDDSGRGVEGLHVPHGSGRMDYHSGGYYEGEWREGQRAGQGRWMYDNSDEYEGNFLDDQPHGTGVHKTAFPRTEYSGDFQGGRYHGTGEWHLIDQRQIFRGHFVDGRRHGNGVLTFLDENGAEVGEMVGTWQHDEMVEVGQANNYSIASMNLLLGYYPKEKLFLEEQDVNSIAARQAIQAASMLPHLAARLPGAYWGPLANGQPHGEQGRCVYSTGDEYVGQWKKGRRNGMGVYRFVNGDVYEGKWVGDVPCGFGRFSTLLGDAYEGHWENNAYHGQGMLINKKEGTIFVGKFVQGKRHGEGRVLEEGSQNVLEEGQYRNDKYIGRS